MQGDRAQIILLWALLLGARLRMPQREVAELAALRETGVGDHRVCRLAAIKSSRRLHRGRQFARRHGRALG